MLRLQGRSRSLGILTVLSVVLLLAGSACGGDDDDDDSGSSGDNFPVFAGAEQVDSASQSTDDLGFEASDGGAVVYTSDAPFADVMEYYNDGVSNDGWTNDQAVEVAEGTHFASFTSKGNQVVIVNILSPEAATEESMSDLMDEAGLELGEGDLEGAQTVIFMAYMTCEEDDTQACLTGLMGQ